MHRPQLLLIAVSTAIGISIKTLNDSRGREFAARARRHMQLFQELAMQDERTLGSVSRERISYHQGMMIKYSSMHRTGWFLVSVRPDPPEPK